jgi:hypothetical protein
MRIKGKILIILGNGRRFSTDNIDRSIEAAIAAAANGADESVESQNVNSDSAEEFTLNLIEVFIEVDILFYC